MKDHPIVLLDSGEKSGGQMQTKKKDRRRLRHEHWLQSKLIVACQLIVYVHLLICNLMFVVRFWFHISLQNKDLSVLVAVTADMLTS